MTDTDVLVVGAGAAGLAVVESLRRSGYDGRMTVLGSEPHLPYDRPPLSKQVLAGEWAPDRTLLRTQQQLDALGATFLLGEAAVALDAGTRRVETSSRTITAGHVVIATGAAPRRLAEQPPLDGVHVLRTLDDALALRADLLTATRLVVVGEGVLGCEIAATARSLGLDVTLAGPQPAPMALQLGPFASGLLATLHEEAGVRLRLGADVVGLQEAAGRVSGVRVADGSTLPADVVVIAIGARPAVGWLHGSGLTLDDGVVCDEGCRAAEGVYAVGDVARRALSWPEGSVRLENRTNATEQAAAVADAILGREVRYLPIPYFWTDQYAARIQVHGTVTPDAVAEVVDGDPDQRRFVARYRVGDRVTAVIGWNMPKQARLRRQEVGAGAINEGVAV